MHYYNDGSDGFVYDPLFRMRTGLTPCEQAVVMHPALRRLQRTAHHGAAARILPMTHTRFTHSLGVFGLAVHFRPTDWVLRVAALLLDAGHLPFSTAAERGLGVDHHELLTQALQRSGLGDLLRRHGFDPADVLGVIEGDPPNPLACGGGGMSLDQLDSWLRDTEALGAGSIPPHLVLERLSLHGPFLEAADGETAREIVRRVAADHRQLHNPRCLALDALVTQIFAQAHPDVEALLDLGDEEALDLAAGTVPDLVDRLRNRPWSVSIRPDDGGPGWPVAVTKICSGQILLGGRPVSEALPGAAAVYASLEKLQQSYKVMPVT
jgi:uncharacterized protein